MRKKFKYYLATNEQSVIEIEDLENSEKYSYKELKKLGIQFYCEIPDINGSGSYCDDINYYEVLTYNKLSELIEDYLYSFDIENMENFNSIAGERINNLIFETIILKQDLEIKSPKKYSIVESSIVANCLNQIMGTEAREIDNINIINFEEKYLEFTKKVESLIEKDFAHLSAASDVTYDFVISKKQKNDIITFEYENGYDEFKKFIKQTLLFNKVVGCTLSTNLSKYNKQINKSPIKKVYGFILYLNNNDEFEIKQSTSKEVLDSYTINSATNEKIEPDKETIYCGEEKNDIICGFDLI
jgi:hypothetical protein